MNKRRSRRLLIAAFAAGTLLFASASFGDEYLFHRSDETRLWFFDVGQGDSALIRSSAGKTMLIDGGPDDAVLSGLAAAMPWWERRIDVVMVTHLDADHFVGLFGVVRKYEIGEIWWTGAVPTTATARKFKAAIETAGIRQRFVRSGERFSFDEKRFLEVLYPEADLRGAFPSKTVSNVKGGGTNDWGLVSLFTCGADRALFTADVSSRVEERLMAERSVQAKLLKVGHHGSTYSSSEPFLDAVRPEEAVISSGAGNRYGHPTSRVLATLLERGIVVHRTDRQGHVRFVCDARGLRHSPPSSILRTLFAK
jgi:competence protein ComEC